MTTVKDPVERFAIDRIHAMLLRTFLAPTSFVAAVMWMIWAQAAEPITVLAPFNLTGPQAGRQAQGRVNHGGGKVPRAIEAAVENIRW